MKKSLIIPLLLLICGSALAKDIIFRSLSTQDGLLHTYVNDLYQDENGMIWIGTYKGLNRYDGSNILNFKYFEDTFNRKYPSYVLSVCGNRDGKVFVAYNHILIQYDIRRDRFDVLLESANITTLFYKHKLYIGKENKIFTYDDTRETFDLAYVFPDPSLKIMKIYVDGAGRVWTGTNKGLYRQDNGDGAPKPVIDSGIISYIYEASDGYFWIGSWEEGLYRLDGEIRRFTHDPNDAGSISSNFVRCICESGTGDLLVGTIRGLNSLDMATGRFTKYTEGAAAGQMTSSSVWSLLKDHQGTIWAGTYFGGLNYFNPRYEIFTYYTASADPGHGLSSPIVGRMLKDERGRLWICTEGGGVTVYDPASGKYEWYKATASKNSISHNNVKSIYYDRPGQVVWLGTHLGGLNKLELRSGKFTHYTHVPGDSTSLPGNIVRQVIPYGDDLVVATQNGLCLFDPGSGKCERLFTDENLGQPQQIADVFIDRDATLWFALTGYGVYSYHFGTGRLRHFNYEPGRQNSISDNMVNSIYQDREGYIWFSTSNKGLDRYDPTSGEFRNYSSADYNLMSDCVYQVGESAVTGTMYLITDVNFASFDKQKQIFHNYTNIPFHDMNDNAMFIDRTGRIFLGGLKGMISFPEDALTDVREPYGILLSRLTVDGAAVKTGDRKKILEKPLFMNDKVSFRCRHSFNIDFLVTDYINSGRKDIEYRLEGFSDSWVKADGYNRITYTNLNPDTYNLVVRSVSPTGEIEAQACVGIKLLPPFYKTTLAYLLYFLVALGIVYFIFRSYINRIRLQESLRYERQRSKDREELNQSKLDFFTSVSHEIRTPLTIILGQIDAILNNEQPTARVSRKLKSMKNVSGHLHDLISELLDFKKQEHGLMKLKISENDMVGLCAGIYSIYNEYAVSKGIRFTLVVPDHAVMLWCDSGKLAKVINNILSNAFKHTPPGGDISMSVCESPDTVTVSIRDSGSGIDVGELDMIFENFYQTDEAKSGSGMGLAIAKNIIDLHNGSIGVESRKGEGSLFNVTLRKGMSHFDSANVINSQTTAAQPASGESVTTDEELDIEAVKAIGAVSERVKILLVEDNEYVLELLGDIFSHLYTVVTARDGEQGVAKAMEEMPDMIVSDVVMPNMSGIELCRRIKSNLETSHIPVILLTAREGIEHTLEGLEARADDYIVKPFNMSVLIRKCNNLINERIRLKEKFGKQPDVSVSVLAMNKMDKDFIDKITGIIEQNLLDPDFNVDDLAMRAGVARTNVYNKVKAITGLTPNKFILTTKLKKGAFMLRNHPGMSISEISYVVGFATPRYFSQCFRENYNVTPKQYRSDANKP